MAGIPRGSHSNKKRKKYSVPPDLPPLLEGMAREVLRSVPNNIYEFLADYVEGLLKQREGGSCAGLGSSASNPQGAVQDMYRRPGEMVDSRTDVGTGGPSKAKVGTGVADDNLPGRLDGVTQTVPGVGAFGANAAGPLGDVGTDGRPGTAPARIPGGALTAEGMELSREPSLMGVVGPGGVPSGSALAGPGGQTIVGGRELSREPSSMGVVGPGGVPSGTALAGPGGQTNVGGRELSREASVMGFSPGDKPGAGAGITQTGPDGAPLVEGRELSRDPSLMGVGPGGLPIADGVKASGSSNAMRIGPDGKPISQATGPGGVPIEDGKGAPGATGSGAYGVGPGGLGPVGPDGMPTSGPIDGNNKESVGGVGDGVGGRRQFGRSLELEGDENYEAGRGGEGTGKGRGPALGAGQTGTDRFGNNPASSSAPVGYDESGQPIYADQKGAIVGANLGADNQRDQKGSPTGNATLPSSSAPGSYPGAAGEFSGRGGYGVGPNPFGGYDDRGQPIQGGTAYGAGTYGDAQRGGYGASGTGGGGGGTVTDGSWLESVVDFMYTRLSAIRRLLTGETVDEEGKGTLMTLAVSLVVGVVIGYAIKSSTDAVSITGAKVFEELGFDPGRGMRPAAACGCDIFRQLRSCT